MAPDTGRTGFFGRRRTADPATTDTSVAADEPLTAERDAETTTTRDTAETVR